MSFLLLAIILAIANYIVRRLREEDIALAAITDQAAYNSGKFPAVTCPHSGKMAESQGISYPAGTTTTGN